MDMSFFVLVGMVAAALIGVLWRGGGGLLVSGLKQTVRLFRIVGPRLLLGMTLGGMIQVIIPSSLVAQWLGPASGLNGILISSLMSIFLIGGPYVVLPIVISLYQAGAGVGPVIALVTGGELLSIQQLLIYRGPFLGMKLSMTQWSISLVLTPLVAIAGSAVFRMLSGM